MVVVAFCLALLLGGIFGSAFYVVLPIRFCGLLGLFGFVSFLAVLLAGLFVFVTFLAVLMDSFFGFASVCLTMTMDGFFGFVVVCLAVLMGSFFGFAAVCLTVPIDGFFGFAAVLVAVLNLKPTKMAAEVAAEAVLLTWLGLRRQNWPRWRPGWLP